MTKLKAENAENAKIKSIVERYAKESERKKDCKFQMYSEILNEELIIEYRPPFLMSRRECVAPVFK
ncbi:hypothetical protein Glove_329g40 [Diversispora epigaea]|uniref:Uncharacterized protein n=1 Tax=Diversispora epigaea TaxID=1348612 RepID=A0A397HQR1_9GLOM|nr:hypothetical protein Glove_329g40 [Diversispora epigaea]